VEHLRRGDLDHAQRRGVLVGDEEQLAVPVQIERLRIAPAGEPRDHPPLREINHRDPVLRVIAGRQILFVHAGPAARRSADRHVERLAAQLEAAGARADGDPRDLDGPLDDRDVTGAFVADVEAIGRGQEQREQEPSRSMIIILHMIRAL